MDIPFVAVIAGQEIQDGTVTLRNTATREEVSEHHTLYDIKLAVMLV